METTDPTSGNLRGLERNSRDVSEFHESASARHSETKSGDACDTLIEDVSNARDVSTTNDPPRNSHSHDVSASEKIPRRSKRLKCQKKPDAHNDQKYVHTDRVIDLHESIDDKSRNNETLSNDEALSDESDDEFIFPEKGGGSDDEFNTHTGRFKRPYKRKTGDIKKKNYKSKKG